MKKLLMAFAMILLVPIMFAGCALFDLDVVYLSGQLNFATSQNDITFKTKSYTEGIYSVKLKTPENKYHVIFNFEIKNESSSDISIDIDNNFIAKINNMPITEAENIDKEYSKSIPTSVAANSSETFAVGYLMDKNWTKIDFVYSPISGVDLALNCSKTTVTYKMMSQSMSPAIPMGTDVEFNVLQNQSLLAGSVVAYYNQNQIWIARIIEVSFDSHDMPIYTTKGDANALANTGTISNEDIIGWTDAYLDSWLQD